MKPGTVKTRPRTRPLLPASGAALALILAAGAVMAARNPATFSGPGRAEVRNGRWARAYERRFEQGLALRGPSLTAWALLRYLLFGEGNRGLLVGAEGWLFSSEEFHDARELDASFRIELTAVREARDRLAARGVELVVALVPAKARVYPERLGRYTLPPGPAGRYERLRGLVAGLGVPAPDLLGPLLRAKAEGPVFLKTDTHWSPRGAGAAAEALAPVIQALLTGAGSPRAGFENSEGPPREYRGDLLNFLPLGRLASRLGPAPDVVRARLTAAAEQPAAGLFDQPAIPVVLAGTSYSAGEVWNLEGALKSAVGADVLNVAKQGQGALAPMRGLLDSPVLQDVQADVVVWEIPERYFVLP